MLCKRVVSVQKYKKKHCVGTWMWAAGVGCSLNRVDSVDPTGKVALEQRLKRMKELAMLTWREDAFETGESQCKASKWECVWWVSKEVSVAESALRESQRGDRWPGQAPTEGQC